MKRSCCSAACAPAAMRRPARAAPGHNPYSLEMDLIDDLKPGEVPVLACGGPTDWIAPWGELLSTAARARGAAGCVTDGLVRDVARIRAMRFPVFHGGIGPLDTKGRAEMVEKDAPVDIAGVRVSPGDWVMGDVDGVVFIPAAGRCGVPCRARQDRGRGHHAPGIGGWQVAACGVCPPRRAVDPSSEIGRGAGAFRAGRLKPLQRRGDSLAP